jgi:GAF domain-containing protein
MDDVIDEGFIALGQFVVGEVAVGETLRQVAELTTQAIPGATFAGITLLSETGPTTAVFTHPAAPEIDQAQYDAGEGPCLEAYRTGEVHRIDSTADDERWPTFSRVALQHDILSTLSVPMVAAGRVTGALNLYSLAVEGFSDDDTRLALVLARQAAVVMANAQAYWQLFDINENLQQALVSRAVIEQAKGILMSQSRIPADEAFAILTRASQRENRKLRDIAQELVARVCQTG